MILFWRWKVTHHTSSPLGPVSDPMITRSVGSSGRRGVWCRARWFRRDQATGQTTLGSMKQETFEGQCDPLKGFMFDCSDQNQVDQFTKTSKEIAKYMGSEYKCGMDMRLSLEHLKLVQQLKCTGGVSSTDLIGTPPGYDTVSYHPHGSASVVKKCKDMVKFY